MRRRAPDALDGRGPLSWRLARRYLRSRAVRWAVLPFSVTTLVLAASYVVLSSTSLTSAQLVQRDLGRFDAAIQLGSVAELHGDEQVLRAPTATLRAAGARDVVPLVESRDVKPDLSASNNRYLEAPWGARPFPDRYRLLGGRWPQKPGEVALTAEAAASARDDKVTVLSGAASWSVVGTVVDEFSSRSSEILAAPGTWVALPWRDLRVKYPNLAGSVTLLASGVDVRAALPVLAGQPTATADGTSAREALEHLREQTQTRDALLGAARRSGAERNPLAFTAPALVVLPLTVILAFGARWRRLLRQSTALRAVGLSMRDATSAVVLSTSVALALGSAVGLVTGWVVGTVGRWVVAPWVGQPLSPVPTPWLLLRYCVAPALVAGVVMAAALLLAQRGRALWSRMAAVPRPARLRNVRHVLGGLALAVVLWQVSSARQMSDATALVPTVTLAVALTGPSALATAAGLLPRRDPRLRLVRQGLLLDRSRVVVTAALIAAATGPLVAILVLNESGVATQLQQTISFVPRHQVQLTTGSEQPLPAAVSRVVLAAVAPSGPPVRLNRLGKGETLVGATPDGFGAVVAVDAPGDFSRLNGTPLTSAQATTLARGGVLFWGDDAVGRRSIYAAPATGRPPRVVGPLTSITAHFDVNWGVQLSAVVLTSTAERWRLPVSSQDLVLTGLTDDQVRRAQQALADAGYDRAYAQVYREPDAFGLSVAQRWAAAALSTLLVLTIAALGRMQYVSLRRYAGTLLAIGLPHGWVSRVLALRLGLVVIGGLLLGTLIAAVPVVVASVRLSGLVIDVPWSLIATVLAVTVVGTLAVTAMGARRLGARATSAASE